MSGECCFTLSPMHSDMERENLPSDKGKELAGFVESSSKYSESYLVHISNLLNHWKPQWSQALRISIVLVIIDLPQYSIDRAIDKFLKLMLHCAPEVARSAPDVPRDPLADIWSLGCVFLEILTVMKEKRVEDIREHTQGRAQTRCYYECDMNDWLEGLKKRTDDVSDLLRLSWVSSMLDNRSATRPSAGTLQREILEANLSFTSAFSFKHHIAPRPASEGLTKDFLDTEGNIRQSVCRDYDHDLSQRYLNNDVVGKGKLNTPIATTAWKQTDGLRQPTIRVYLLDEENLGPVKAMPSSKLAATSWRDGQVFFYYQAEDGTIKSLYQRSPENQWEYGPRVEDAAPGSPLPVSNSLMYDKHGIRF
ncbi:hypothetical protein FGADI_9450 [Fusarium gaditjirri]|uniref:Protein kinase domain-containing protein n=1 Tax=Fusarium gaditjirri TaxID=282569 RepID=A0A8H4SZU0_9HYPO|nr:hypothetical protein FGADI_9450 [Fusarium gaditjirri]